jgi:hypothetical protein
MQMFCQTGAGVRVSISQNKGQGQGSTLPLLCRAINPNRDVNIRSCWELLEGDGGTRFINTVPPWSTAVLYQLGNTDTNQACIYLVHNRLLACVASALIYNHGSGRELGPNAPQGGDCHGRWALIGCLHERVLFPDYLLKIK